jgi:hypothetical protein
VTVKRDDGHKAPRRIGQAQRKNPPGPKSNRLKIKEDTGVIVPGGGQGPGGYRWSDGTLAPASGR